MADIKDLYWQDSIEKQIIIAYSGGTITNTELYYEQLSLTESICTGGSLKFGGCEAAVLKFRVSKDVGPLKGKTITISQDLNNELENPFVIGTYKVDSDRLTADKSQRDVVAYDAMYTLISTDITEWYNGLIFPLSIKQFRDLLFEYLGVEQEDVELPNDSAFIRETVDYEELFAGDVLKDICEVNGCFGKMGRNNTFRYVFLSETSKHEITKQLYGKGDLQYEDYITATIDCVALLQSNTDFELMYSESTQNNIYTLETRVLYFGDDEEKLNKIASALYNTISTIQYVPFSLSCVGNPCVDCGDKVDIVLSEGKKISTYVLERKMTGIQVLKDNLTAEGSEYYEKKQSSSNSIIRSINSKITKIQKDGFYSMVFTNSLEYVLDKNRQTIINFKVASVEETDVILVATIPMIASKDGEVVINFARNATIIPEDEVRQYVHKGNNVITLTNYFNMMEYSSFTLTVMAHMEYVESVERQHEAKIISFENYINTGEYTEVVIDASTPTANIHQWGIKAILFARGVAGGVKWDGTIDIAETAHMIPIEPMNVALPKESYDFGIKMALLSNMTAAIPLMNIEPMNIMGAVDELVFNPVVTHYVFNTTKKDKYEYDINSVSAEESYALASEFIVESEEQPIDIGKMYMIDLDINRTHFVSVDDVEIRSDIDE